MIVSHHGKYEFGSPKLPQFPEALLFHYLDDMDSKMECMRTLIEHDRQIDGHFTGYNVSLERTVLKKAKYMSNEADAARRPQRVPSERASAERTQSPPAPAPDERPSTPPSGGKPVPKEASHPLFAAPPAQES
jgi:3'-5' exoribonuclease